jgi:hypothetical protein
MLMMLPSNGSGKNFKADNKEIVSSINGGIKK